jgi:hypothetical protein
MGRNLPLIWTFIKKAYSLVLSAKQASSGMFLCGNIKKFGFFVMRVNNNLINRAV